MDAHSVKVTCEISLAWFKQHPDLGVASLTKFYEQHPSEQWSVRADQSRTGYLHLVAVRKDSA